MSTLGSLIGMLGESQIRPWSQGVIEANRADTGLIELANLQRQQEAEAVARQAIQASGGRILGGGGAQSLLASPALTMAPGGGPMPALGPHPVTQQTVIPGQPPGSPQPVPGGMDLSQFASGSPPQSTLGSLAPTPQQDPMETLFRTNPDAALIIQKQQQAQQDRQWKIQETQLNIREKVAGAVGQLFQGVTDQASYDEARAQVQQFNPRLAAQLPSVYNTDLVQRLVKQAVDVKSSATLAIQNMQAQAEIGKYNLQLQNAGYQGLGEGVTSILKGLTPEQVEEFGGRTSQKAIAYATQKDRETKAPPGQTAEMTTELRAMGVNPFGATEKQLQEAQANIQKRALAKEGEAQRLKHEQEQELQKTMPLQDARKEDADRFVYKGTGQTVPGTIPYGDVKTLQAEKDPTKGVVHLTTDAQKQLTTLKQLEPVLDQYRELIQYAYGPGGPMEQYKRSPVGVFGAAFRQALQTDPKLEALRRGLMGQLQSVVRGLGARGDLNEAELKAATEMIANFDASGGLGLSLGPMLGTGGVGVGAQIKPSLSIPDTPQVGLELANNLIETVNKRVGSILQNEQYARTPKITLGETPGPSQPPSAAPGVPPRTWGEMQPVTPGQPTPPAPGQGTPPALPEVPATRPGTPPGRQSAVQRPGWPKVASVQDVAEAMRQTGKDRKTIEKAMRDKGYTVYGSKLPLPEVTLVG